VVALKGCVIQRSAIIDSASIAVVAIDRYSKAGAGCRIAGSWVACIAFITVDWKELACSVVARIGGTVVAVVAHQRIRLA
jgi:hypothetical protein